MNHPRRIPGIFFRPNGRSIELVLVGLLLVGLLLAGLLVAGCGEKIAIPEAEGLFSTSGYLKKSEFEFDQLQQLVVAGGVPFVLTADSLFKREIDFDRYYNTEDVEIVVGGLSDARALCVSDFGSLIFVWEQGNHRVSWYDGDELGFVGESFLPDVVAPVAMTTSVAGAELLGVDTFLYLSDPDAGVIHRFAFSELQGLFPYGILARADGDGTRFVHVAGGMSRDHEGRLLVCDADPGRNWVIRFDSTPDPEDFASDPDEEDPLRGTAIWYGETPSCEPPAQADFVLGDAAICGQTDWVGGISDEKGKFNSPWGVTADGSGRIFVADTGNNRVQAFSAVGEFELAFGDADDSPSPMSIGVVDKFEGLGVDERHFAAFVFLAHPQEGVVSRWVSKKYNDTLDEDYFEQ